MITENELPVTFDVKEDLDGDWSATFKIDHQTFSLEPNGDKEHAQWFIEQLKTAFTRLCNKPEIQNPITDDEAEYHTFEVIIGGKKMWRYFYNDEHGLNQHSNPFPTKENAKQNYKKLTYEHNFIDNQR